MVALAGYTNAGKSKLLNRLTGADVLVEDALFATLDPTVRRATTPHGRAFTLADTVGFVRHLPHQLVEAFRSTLEEVRDADLIVHVVDCLEEVPAEQIAAVREVLQEIDADRIPELIVMNKVDAASADHLTIVRHQFPDAVFISAQTGEGIDVLMDRIEALLPNPMCHVDVVVPYARGDLVARAHTEGDVVEEDYVDVGTHLIAQVPEDLAAALRSVHV